MISEKIEIICCTVNVHPVFKSTTYNAHLMSVNNQVPNEKKKGVVYRIPCKDCSEYSTNSIAMHAYVEYEP